MRHALVGYKPKNDYAYNPDKAKQLLAEGGWDSNREVTGQRPSAGLRDGARHARSGAAQLQTIGVKTKWEELESSVWVDKFYKNHTHDMVWIPATNFVDPHLFLDFHFTSTSRNGVGYATPAFDATDREGPARDAPRSARRRSTRQSATSSTKTSRGSGCGAWPTSTSSTAASNIPFIPVPATNPKTIAEVPFTASVQALPTWYYRTSRSGPSAGRRGRHAGELATSCAACCC